MFIKWGFTYPVCCGGEGVTLFIFGVSFLTPGHSNDPSELKPKFSFGLVIGGIIGGCWLDPDGG